MIRWLSVVISEAAAKHCPSLCSTEHPFQIQNLSIFHATQRTAPTDKPPPSRLQKISSPLALVSLLVLQLFRYSTGFPLVWRTMSDPEGPDAPSDDSSFSAVVQQQRRACVRNMRRCKLACILPSSSLDPRLAPRAFEVAKDESRDRFIGDRRQLNSNE